MIDLDNLDVNTNGPYVSINERRRHDYCRDRLLYIMRIPASDITPLTFDTLMEVIGIRAIAETGAEDPLSTMKARWNAVNRLSYSAEAWLAACINAEKEEQEK